MQADKAKATPQMASSFVLWLSKHAARFNDVANGFYHNLEQAMGAKDEASKNRFVKQAKLLQLAAKSLQEKSWLAYPDTSDEKIAKINDQMLSSERTLSGWFSLALAQVLDILTVHELALGLGCTHTDIAGFKKRLLDGSISEMELLHCVMLAEVKKENLARARALAKTQVQAANEWSRLVVLYPINHAFVMLMDAECFYLYLGIQAHKYSDTKASPSQTLILAEGLAEAKKQCRSRALNDPNQRLGAMLLLVSMKWTDPNLGQVLEALKHSIAALDNQGTGKDRFLHPKLPQSILRQLGWDASVVLLVDSYAGGLITCWEGAAPGASSSRVAVKLYDGSLTRWAPHHVLTNTALTAQPPKSLLVCLKESAALLSGSGADGVEAMATRFEASQEMRDSLANEARAADAFYQTWAMTVLPGSAYALSYQWYPRPAEDPSPVQAIILLLLYVHAFLVHCLVHGDILFRNTVGSVLIDPDMTRPQGSLYPLGYNTKFEERHPEAQPQAKMEISHDVHALGILLRDNWHLPEAGQLLLDAAFNSEAEASLKTAILEAVKALMVLPASEQHSVVAAAAAVDNVAGDPGSPATRQDVDVSSGSPLQAPQLIHDDQDHDEDDDASGAGKAPSMPSIQELCEAHN